jgi:hypothetical protein
MVMNEMKKCITMIMMMLMVMLVVTKVCNANQSLDTSTGKYCDDCRLNCVKQCGSYFCVGTCMEKNCRCCVTKATACV